MVCDWLMKLSVTWNEESTGVPLIIEWFIQNEKTMISSGAEPKGALFFFIYTVWRLEMAPGDELLKQFVFFSFFFFEKY